MHSRQLNNQNGLPARRRVLLIEAYTDANIGSGALVLNSVEIVRKLDPNAEIRVMAHFPNAFEQLDGVTAVADVFRFPYGERRIDQVLWLFRTVSWMATAALQAILGLTESLSKGRVSDFAWADVVVSVGAERLNDKYPKNIAFSLFAYWLAKTMGKTVVIFPSTIGPLFRPLSRFFTQRVLQSLDLVLVRDHQSAEIVQSLSEGSERNVRECTDVAVLQNPHIPDQAEFRNRFAIPDNVPIVGISAMRWTYVHNRVETPFSNYESYLRELALLADTIVERYGVFVVFYPTNYPERGCREDDVVVAREVYGRMKNRSSAAVLDQLPSPQAFQGMLALSEVNVVTRMHACILSTAAKVPTLSINYLFKLRGYMEKLGLSEFSIDIEEFSCAEMLGRFDRMWCERVQWRCHLEKKLEELRSSLWLTLGEGRDLV